MARAWDYDVRSLLNGAQIVAGHFTVDGANDPDGVLGRHFTVAHSDVGKYTLTFSKGVKWTHLFPMGQPAVVYNGDDKDYTAHWGTITSAPTGTTQATAVIYVQSAGSDADVDNAVVSFALLGVSTGDNITIVA